MKPVKPLSLAACIGFSDLIFTRWNWSDASHCHRGIRRREGSALLVWLVFLHAFLHPLLSHKGSWARLKSSCSNRTFGLGYVCSSASGASNCIWCNHKVSGRFHISC